MTAGDVDRRRTIRREADRDHREFSAREALVSAALVVCVIVAAVFGSWLADRLNDGPGARNAATQSAENGERLCDIATALSKVVLVFSTSDQLNDEQRAALAELDEVADDCQHKTTTTGES